MSHRKTFKKVYQRTPSLIEVEDFSCIVKKEEETSDYDFLDIAPFVKKEEEEGTFYVFSEWDGTALKEGQFLISQEEFKKHYNIS